jgi:hypothetical protein
VRDLTPIAQDLAGNIFALTSKLTSEALPSFESALGALSRDTQWLLLLEPMAWASTYCAFQLQQQEVVAPTEIPRFLAELDEIFPMLLAAITQENRIGFITHARFDDAKEVARENEIREIWCQQGALRRDLYVKVTARATSWFTRVKLLFLGTQQDYVDNVFLYQVISLSFTGIRTAIPETLLRPFVDNVVSQVRETARGLCARWRAFPVAPAN